MKKLQVSKPTLSVTFAVMFTIELKNGVLSSREAFILGGTVAGSTTTVITVEFCLTLLLVSVA